MKVVQTPTFKRKYKKLNSTQRQIVREAISKISLKPTIGILKTGDLSGVRVYKFKMLNQEILLAYDVSNKLILLALGGHENFYRDLKK